MSEMLQGPQSTRDTTTSMKPTDITMTLNPYLSIITLNVNRPNDPTERLRVSELIKKNKMGLLQRVNRWALFFFIHSDTLYLLTGAFSPFTFSVIIERYGFRVIVMSVGFMLVLMSLVLFGPCNISLTESPLGSLVGLV